MKHIFGAIDVNLSHALTSNSMAGLTVTLRVDTNTGNQMEFDLPPAVVKSLFPQLVPQFMSACSMVYALEAQEHIQRRK